MLKPTWTLQFGTQWFLHSAGTPSFLLDGSKSGLHRVPSLPQVYTLRLTRPNIRSLLGLHVFEGPQGSQSLPGGWRLVQYS